MPILDEAGNVRWIVQTLKNISRTNLVWAGQIAHDFNNLMVGVLSNVDFLLEAASLDTLTKECLNDISEAAGKAAAIARKLSDLSSDPACSAQTADPRFDPSEK